VWRVESRACEVLMFYIYYEVEHWFLLVVGVGVEKRMDFLVGR
jgi:hypothetical protein